MSRRRSLSDEERALWGGLARSVKPLRRPRDFAASATRAEAADAALPRVAAPRPAPPGQLAPPLAPLGRRFRQRVARGREPIDDRLDLHGLTQTQAHTALLRFLRRAQANEAKIVLIVTGKGTGRASAARNPDAAERGVLRRQVPLWLALPEFRSFVLGFEDAHIGHGGQGALYVRLRRPR
jgi:DNA-nicking Smr family endonuclease